MYLIILRLVVIVIIRSWWVMRGWHPSNWTTPWPRRLLKVVVIVDVKTVAKVAGGVWAGNRAEVTLGTGRQTVFNWGWSSGRTGANHLIQLKFSGGVAAHFDGRGGQCSTIIIDVTITMNSICSCNFNASRGEDGVVGVAALSGGGWGGRGSRFFVVLVEKVLVVLGWWFGCGSRFWLCWWRRWWWWTSDVLRVLVMITRWETFD